MRSWVLSRIESGSIRFNGEELAGRTPSEISQLGIGYVPQGRRLWRSLTVDEHLRLVGAGRRGAWTIERIYSTFPRLAERKGNSGGQLSGGEQQMLAIGRALITNPKLLIMDEPTEGLAPVIVTQVEDMLLRIGEQGEIDVLVIEQNIHVATTVSETRRHHDERTHQADDQFRTIGGRPRIAAAPARRRPACRRRARGRQRAAARGGRRSPRGRSMHRPRSTSPIPWSPIAGPSPYPSARSNRRRAPSPACHPARARWSRSCVPSPRPARASSSSLARSTPRAKSFATFAT